MSAWLARSPAVKAYIGHSGRRMKGSPPADLCPSCWAYRMAQTAAHLVDPVIPHVPVRQWVLSLPIPLRPLLAAQPKLVMPVPQVVHRVITRTCSVRPGSKHPTAKPLKRLSAATSTEYKSAFAEASLSRSTWGTA